MGIFLVLAAVLLGGAALATVLVERRRGTLALDPRAEPRSALWALLLIATVPVAVVATGVGAQIVGLFTGRCGLYGCKSNWSLSQVDFSTSSVIATVVIGALIFGIWLLALLPSPVPRNTRTRNKLRLAVASAFTLLAVYDAFLGL